MTEANKCGSFVPGLTCWFRRQVGSELTSMAPIPSSSILLSLPPTPHLSFIPPTIASLPKGRCPSSAFHAPPAASASAHRPQVAVFLALSPSRPSITLAPSLPFDVTLSLSLWQIPSTLPDLMRLSPLPSPLPSLRPIPSSLPTHSSPSLPSPRPLPPPPSVFYTQTGCHFQFTQI